MPAGGSTSTDSAGILELLPGPAQSLPELSSGPPGHHPRHDPNVSLPATHAGRDENLDEPWPQAPNSTLVGAAGDLPSGLSGKARILGQMRERFGYRGVRDGRQPDPSGLRESLTAVERQ